MRIVVKLFWDFVFISMNGNAILSNITNMSPDYWTYIICIMLLDRQFSNYLLRKLVVMRTMLLSFKPEWYNKIMDGSKIFEYRRTFPNDVVS